jgi:hypothetical protein
MDNSYTSIYPLLVFARCLGFFPCQFVGSVKDGVFKVTKLSVIQTILVILSLAALIASNVCHYVFYKVYKNEFLNIVVWSWILLLGYSSIILLILIHFTKLNGVIKFLRSINKIDAKIEKLNLKINYARHFNFNFVLFSPFTG